MLFLLFRVENRKPYTRSYFFDEYRAQYGKTYLEDFDSIKARGLERMSIIDSVYSSVFGIDSGVDKNVLDVGCAYGPFLSAARDLGWNAFGTDIAEDAVAYVRDELHIPAWQSAFPASDAENRTGERTYAAVTFWYVIEHFKDLSAVLDRARKLLVNGGILALSTPTETGVSGLFSRASFLGSSPIDHYTIWNHRAVRRQLARYGYSVKKIVSTGHHVERFPLMKILQAGRESPRRFNAIIASMLTPACGAACSFASRAFRLGDTFEVYAIKNGTLEDAQ
jgi:2-polyprenyl-3-methyl-5-hydroxy-6-metoxy-1,4-benzoquinol methylase